MTYFLLNGFGCNRFGCAVVLPAGTHYNVTIPPSIYGLSVLLQAFAFPVPGVGIPPLNGVFAASEAHEIQVL